MSDRTVTLTLDPDDVIDAIGSLEMRAIQRRLSAEIQRREGNVIGQRLNIEKAARYDAVAQRLREAMESARAQG